MEGVTTQMTRLVLCVVRPVGLRLKCMKNSTCGCCIVVAPEEPITRQEAGTRLLVEESDACTSVCLFGQITVQIL